VGYAVSDVETAAQHWTATVGAGPFFLLPPSDFEEVVHDGSAATFEHRSAFGQWGSIAVELQQIDDARPAAVADALARAPGLNHVSYMTDDLEAESARLVERGMPVVLAARGGPVRLSFHRAPELGHAIELHQRCDFLVEFFEMLERESRDWDGSDPLRS
jgi:hypothetical protein